MTKYSFRTYLFTASLLACAVFPLTVMGEQANDAKSYDDLLVLFEDWRQFEQPPSLEGAPDYTAQTDWLPTLC